MIKAGVAGAGHLGKIHLKLLNQSTQYNLVGFYDVDKDNGLRIEKEFGYKFYENLDDLLGDIDMLDIVSPTLSHHNLALKAIEEDKHIFIEKPIAHTLEEAREIASALNQKGLKGQVGHVERFNPAFLAVADKINQPLFIETHRLAEFNPRGTDVPVVLDLMIHDLDIILSIVNSPVKEIRSSGVNVISDTPDIANARIVFENGCVVNVTTSRISMKNMRKTRVFQKDAYISIDFLEKKSEVIRMEDAGEIEPDDFSMILENAEKKKKKISFEYPKVEPNNAILEELESFAHSIEKDEVVQVPIKDGIKALKLALDVIDNFAATQIEFK
ncbi:gfo/Idh/MocA family oxidoreductase [Flavobacteriaceae bacterium Ap0902]|nr:gfo/Idh/MocA family oxidoreductase [Flavobacteriaceae bacterium Ap0902]